MGIKTAPRLSPAQTIVLSIFLTIIAGTCLLALPAARVANIPLIDLFFTATSATCVTGLFTISLNQFTTFGHTIILILIQIGGLGLITLSLFLISLFVNLGLGAQVRAGQMLEIESFKQLKRLLIVIACITLSAELLGTACMTFSLIKDYPFTQAFFLSLFHAISSYCNAGISLVHDNVIIPSAHNYVVLLTTTVLMLIGGLGFFTWYEILQSLVARVKKKRYRFSLHSKIVLYGTAILLLISGILFFILEHDNTLFNLSIPHTIAYTLFNIVSFRSTGFLATPIGELQLATLCIIMLFSFIGSSPGSTGSGIKITTLAIFLASIKSTITGRASVEIKGRQIAKDQTNKAISIIALSFSWILLTTFCLIITEEAWPFFDLLFEAFAAFTTLGISTGVTPTLSTIGKFFIITSMIIGRIGSLTLILALKFKKKTEKTDFSYPEERIMLG